MRDWLISLEHRPVAKAGVTMLLAVALDLLMVRFLGSECVAVLSLVIWAFSSVADGIAIRKLAARVEKIEGGP